MKSATTLKESLKPPFYHGSGLLIGNIFSYTDEAKYIRAHLLLMQSQEYFQCFENGEQLQDEFKEFVVQALNEKWERDFGNPRTCSCCYNNKDYQLFYRGNEMDMKYCPFCGRLLPPEEAHHE
ncbi:MAG: hypothetical protein LBQ89_07935 [Treponema sp.]|jgi:hypothetical protein|nr:hypothetical protein [Treponema sp.]